MLSINSLSESLLPNLYVKSLDLQTFSATTVAKKNVPKYQGPGFSSPEVGPDTMFNIGASKTNSECNIVLSVKSLKTSTYSEEIIELLNSEFSDNIKIFAHQITDRFLYESILQALASGTDLNNNNSIVDLELPTEANFKSIIDVITREDTKNYVDGLKTQVFNFIDIPLWNKFSKKSTFTTVSTPEQILDDGTILNEGILNLSFKFKKDTSFLAYLFIVGVKAPSANIASITSKPTAEVILIDGKFQNTGVIFTISQDQAGTSFDELTDFGKPGDVWAGGVHLHQGRYMAGTKHTTQPHAYLDYQFVEVAKFSDNRTLERRSLTPFDVTKKLNTVESSVNVFKNNLNLAKFSDYKKKTYTSDIMLSQNKKNHVNGVFFVDKHEIIRNNCAFPFIFQNIDLAFDQPGSSPGEKTSVIASIAAKSQMLSLKVYGPYYGGSYAIEDELLKTMSGEEISATQNAGSSLAIAKNENTSISTSLKIKKITDIGIKPNENEIETFIFKHYVGNALGDSTKHKYRYEVEYKDPTISIVKGVLLAIKSAKADTQSFINYIQSISGFEQYSQKIKDKVLKSITPENFDWVSTGTKPYYIKGVSDLASFNLAYVLFYNPNFGKKPISQSEFSKQLRHLSRLETTSLDKVNVLFAFLTNLESTLELALNSVTAKKQNKNSGASQNQYDQNVATGNVFSTRLTKTIKAKSKDCYINITDHGYDFLGQFTHSKINKNNFNKIFSNDFKAQCNMLFSKQFSTLSGDDMFTEERIEEALDLNYKPTGFSFRSPRENLYTFLNIPINAARDCVMLPETVINLNSNISPLPRIQQIVLAVLKYKRQIFENYFKPDASPQEIITADVLSLLGQGTGNKSVASEVSKTSNNSLNQQDTSFSAPQDLGNALETKIPSIASKILKKNIFKFTPPKFNTLIDDLPNYVLLSMLYRQLFTNTANQTGFKLQISQSDFEPYKDFAELIEVLQTPLPLNVLCLSINSGFYGPLKNFINNNLFYAGQTYIKSGVVMPAMMPHFWFIHQNIAFVEYLEDFETEEQTSLLKVDSDTPISENGGFITTKTRNIQKPIFKPITNTVLNSKKTGVKLICRLTPYENSTYINKKLLNELKMPFINNYFILEIN